MHSEDIPQELVDLVDERARKKHSREGIVLTTLAEVLTRYDEIKSRQPLSCPNCAASNIQISFSGYTGKSYVFCQDCNKTIMRFA